MGARGLEPALIGRDGGQPAVSDLAPTSVVMGGRASEVGATGFVNPTGSVLASAVEPGTPGTGWVRLVDATSSEAIPGAEVVFRVSTSLRGSGPRQVTYGSLIAPRAAGESTRHTDFEGLVRVPTGGAVLHAQVSVEGYGPAWFVSSVAGPSPSQATRVALGREASLLLVAVDVDGQPVGDVTVQLRASFYHLVKRRYGFISGPGFTRFSATGEDGRCQMDNLPSDVPFELTLRPPGRPFRSESRPLVLAAGEERRNTA